MIHINVIPLNPTGGYGGGPSGRERVNVFCNILEKEYGVACTPRVRRGIDISAGCGMLKADVEKRERDKSIDDTENIVDEEPSLADFVPSASPVVGVYEDDEEEIAALTEATSTEEFTLDDEVYDFEEDDFEDYVYSGDEKDEADRLINLVKGTVVTDLNRVIRSEADIIRKTTNEAKP
jgi:hypothetical protein